MKGARTMTISLIGLALMVALTCLVIGAGLMLVCEIGKTSSAVFVAGVRMIWAGCAIALTAVLVHLIAS